MFGLNPRPLPPLDRASQAGGAAAYLGWIALDGSLIIWPPLRRRLGQSYDSTTDGPLKGPTTSASLQEDEEEDGGGWALGG